MNETLLAPASPDEPNDSDKNWQLTDNEKAALDKIAVHTQTEQALHSGDSTLSRKELKQFRDAVDEFYRVPRDITNVDGGGDLTPEESRKFDDIAKDS